MNFKKQLDHITSTDKSSNTSDLSQLSGLSKEEINKFQIAWAKMESNRKYNLLMKLHDLSEVSPQMDFSDIFRICLNDADNTIREQAIYGLWEYDDRVIINPIITILTNDPSNRVRVSAAKLLAKFADMAQEGKLLKRDSVKIRNALINVIRENTTDLQVKKHAIESIACFNEPEIHQIIHEAYQTKNSELERSAIHAMGRSSNIQWLSILIKETNHENLETRCEAIYACGQLGDETTVPHIINLIQDDDIDVQLSAIRTLGTIGGSLAKQTLTQILNSGDDLLKDEVECALTKTSTDENPMDLSLEYW